MAVVSCEETLRGRGLTASQDRPSATRSFSVLLDSPAAGVYDIASAPGIKYGDAHPDDSAIKAVRFECRPTGDAALLYEVNVTYEVVPKTQDSGDSGGGGGGGGGSSNPVPAPVWSATSSVTSAPVYKDITGKVLVNSAGVAFRDVVADKAEFRMAVTFYYSSLAWMTDAYDYTNSINSDNWLGCMPTQWKCQGCSVEQSFLANFREPVRTIWRTTWSFDFNVEGWALNF